jgi:antirestriction protein ArdC
MTVQDMRAEALTRAKTSESYANYPAIIEGFMAKGIAATAINPRVNVFTYRAWQALGRTVRKGEHGVRVTTFAEYQTEDRVTGEKQTHKRPWHTTVFHESQTEPMTGGAK